MLNVPELVPAEFCAWTVKEYVPVELGVPLITPVEESERPGGSEPLVTAHVIGAVPDAVRVSEYAVRTCADGSEVVVIAGGVAAEGGAELQERLAFAQSA
jgi:hypothetical protein